MITRNKRGQLGNLNGIIITLVIVGILIGVAFLVLDSLKTSFTTTTNTATAEIVTPTDAGVYLAHNVSTAGDKCYGNPVIVSVYNYSGNVPITAGNYSVNDFGLFKNLSSQATYNRAWNVTYTFETGDDACKGVADTITATRTIPTFLPILVIILVVGVLLLIVFKILPSGGSGGFKGSKETAYV